MQLSTLGRTAQAVIDHAGEAMSLAERAGNSGGDDAVRLLDEALGHLRALDGPLESGFAASTATTFGELGGIANVLEGAGRNLATAREIAESGSRDGLFNAAYGAVQKFGAARSYARDLALFA